MIWVKIDGEEHRWGDVDKSWIAKAIEGTRKAGRKPCVQIRLECDSARMRLTTPDCSAGGGGRPPNQQEAEIFDLWAKRGLNQRNFTPGNVIAFLAQVERLVPCG